MSKHWLFVLILLVGSFIRLYHIQSDMIFIGDQGRDFIAAREIIVHHTIPLLGIPSSLPRFRQGPLYIYALAIIFFFTQGSPQAAGIFAAFMGIAAIIGAYILLEREESKTTALITALFISLSPMAILHSRMPFLINPLPLFTLLYLHQLVRLSKGKRFALFGAGLSFALLFQCELAVFPLSLLIIYACYVSRQPIRKSLLPIVLGLGFGIFPEIIYDCTHQFSQLGGFLFWTIYKIATVVIPHIHHSGPGIPLSTTLQSIHDYMLEIFIVQVNTLFQIPWLIVLLVGMLRGLRLLRTRVSFVSLSSLGLCLMLFAFLIHKAPSEAYFPVCISMIAIVIGNFISRVPKYLKILCFIFLFASFFISTRSILLHRYFLQEAYQKPDVVLRNGPSLAMQQKMIHTIQDDAQGQCIVLHSEERDLTFPTLINNFEYLQSLEPRGNPPCVDYWIDRVEVAKTYQSRPTKQIDFGSYEVSTFQLYVSER